MHPRYNRGREGHGAADWQAGSILYFTKSLTSFSHLYFYPLIERNRVPVFHSQAQVTDLRH
jgi:hypothetical protein